MATEGDMLMTAENVTDFLSAGEPGRSINVPGLIAIIIFYLLILGIGLWAAWRKRGTEDSAEEVMLAGRDIGIFVGCLTMTATWVGGGYINGSAEAVFTSGLIWCQAPFGYAISLTLGGLFFARKMRDARYVTMLDPLQNVFGQRWGAMLYLPALAGETLWSAAILSALGSTLAVILDLSNNVSIIVSAAIAVVYTLFGGLYSVAYTDVVQLFCIFIGLWISIPFALMHEAVGSLSLNETDWLGSIDADTPWVWGEWTDFAVLLIFGGIPWQVYFQRVLSARTSKQAQMLSFVGSFGCFFMAVPACIIGAIAKATDWNQTDYTKDITQKDQAKLVLPLVMQYLTPQWVAFFGLGAVSAAVMSSADSSVLSASSMFSNNIYKNVFRQNASDRELVWVMRFTVLVVACISTVIAIKGNSIYELFYLCGDFVYVMLFPQLTLAVHAPNYVNTYGSICGYVLGFILRILGGEKVLGIPAVIKYPFYIDGVQYFPFRTLAMAVTMVTLLLVSWLVRSLHNAGKFPDFLNALSQDTVAVLKRGDEAGPGGIDNPALDASTPSEKKAPPPSYRDSVEMTQF
ncbi:high-affinity choline transporter 1 [Penaeus vannamei]|uniref:high-affinity choline transporter 1 n=1 Tax=Penaeus vannamei TaxID=6689 RepID=UPI000F6748BC|nr:high-affinity choline transporter 1-like [Penaeus vannamei]XP_027208715.1 high-affinity choline transporter 1-like [Penaeus vannamei]